MIFHSISPKPTPFSPIHQDFLWNTMKLTREFGHSTFVYRPSCKDSEPSPLVEPTLSSKLSQIVSVRDGQHSV
uniref:U520, putative n=1 Tax=Arundo donax TaxID=35708 RepID=A0A0A9HR22_ARUDO